jgi:hypothetical protein
MTSILPELTKVAVQFLLTGNAVAAALTIGVLSSDTSTSIKLAAVPPLLSFGVGLICGVLFLTFYLGYLIELRGSGKIAGRVFSFVSAFAGLLSVVSFVLGVVLTLNAALALRTTL